MHPTLTRKAWMQPSNAAIAGMVCAGIVAAGLAIGLGVGLTRDDNDSELPIFCIFVI